MTCNGGTCLPLPDKGIVVCDGCEPNYDPVIRDIHVDDAYVIPPTTAEFNVALPGLSTGLFDKRIMVATAVNPDIDDSPTVVAQVWHMGAGASATFELEADRAMVVGTLDTVYKLKTPQALAVDHSLYVAPTAATSASARTIRSQMLPVRSGRSTAASRTTGSMSFMPTPEGSSHVPAGPPAAHTCQISSAPPAGHPGLRAGHGVSP